MAIPHVAGATSLPGSGSGSAYAAYLAAKLPGTTVTLGTLVPVSVCPTGTEVSGNSVASISNNPFLSSGTAADKVQTYHTSTTATEQSTSSIQNVSVLGGLITATALKAVATSYGTTTGATSSAAGTTFTNLVVAGTAINASVSPNSKITLPGIGYVILNQQTTSSKGNTFTNLAVNMISVFVTTSNALGIPAGTNFVVGHAQSDLTLTAAPFDVTAGAYGLYGLANAGNTLVSSGPFAPVGLCGAGTAKTAQAATSTPFGPVGAMQDFASGYITNSGVSASGIADVASLNLLGGLISGGALQANAAAAYTGTATNGTGSALFTNLTIAGLPIDSAPPANTTIELLGFGYVVLNEQDTVVSKAGILLNVTALDLYITTPNTLGLPVGAELKIGKAKAGITGY